LAGEVLPVGVSGGASFVVVVVQGADCSKQHRPLLLPRLAGSWGRLRV